MKLATAYVEIRSDTKAYDRDLAEVERKSVGAARSIAGQMAQIFGAAAFAAGLKRSVDAAARLEQAVGATETVFGSASKTVDEFARNSAKGFGISNAAARELTGTMGSLLKNMGYSREEAAETAVTMAKLGADLAAAFGGRPEEAVQALTAALRGERDPIERYGVAINEASVKTKAFELGLYSGKGQIDANAKAQATLALITQQTADVQGQFAREANTAAGAAAIAAAQAEDSAASLGTNFLPVYTRVVQVVGALAAVFAALPGPVQVAVVALVGFVALSGPLGNVTRLVRDQLVPAFQKLSTTTQSAAVGLGVFAGVALVGFSLRAKQAEERARAIADGINELSTAADAEVLATYLRTLKEMVLAGTGGADPFYEIAAANLEGARRALEMAEASGVQTEALDRMRAAIAEVEREQAQGAATMDAYGGAADDAGDDIASLEEQQRLAAEASDALARSLEPTRTEMAELADAADELRKAIDEVFGPTMDLEEANRRWQQGMDDLRATLEANGATLDITTAKGRDNRKAIQEQADAALDLATTMVANGSSMDEAAIATALYTEAIKAQMRQAGLTEEQIEEYLETLGLTPERVATTIELAGDNAAKARIEELLGQLGEVDAPFKAEIAALIDQRAFAEAEERIRQAARQRNVSLKVTATGGGTVSVGGGSFPIRVMAEGGKLTSPTFMLGGEAGPEVVLPLTRPSRIRELLADPEVARPVAAAMGGAPGSSSTVHASIAVYGAEHRYVAEIAREIRFQQEGAR